MSSGPVDRVAIAVDVAQAEILAKILIQFDTHVDVDKLDFPFDRTQWHHLAIDLLKARAVAAAARAGVPIAGVVVGTPAAHAVDAAAQKLVDETERHLKQVAPE